jgi:GDP-mannose 6-dehydrogenase
VVIRRTVLPGMTEDRLISILEECSGKSAGSDFGVCMNPELLRESNAVADFFDPGLVIIGELDERSGEILEALYSNVQATTIRTTLRTAEMVNYANNAFHALKVTFADEIGVLCKPHGIDSREVMEILCQDTRLNISKTQPEERALQAIPAAACSRR